MVPRFRASGTCLPASRADSLRSASPAALQPLAVKPPTPSSRTPRCSIPKSTTPGSRAPTPSNSGYEYEHVWMGVLDNNPLYGQFTYGGGYSACAKGTVVPGVGTCSSASGTPLDLSTGKVADTYIADFLFGITSAYALANYFEAHLRQTRQRLRAGRLEGPAQPDLEPRSPLGIRFALFGE